MKVKMGRECDKKTILEGDRDVNHEESYQYSYHDDDDDDDDDDPLAHLSEEQRALFVERQAKLKRQVCSIILYVI